MVEMKVKENGSTTSSLFSGDWDGSAFPLNPDPDPPPPVDFMLLESTYGDRFTAPTAFTIRSSVVRIRCDDAGCRGAAFAVGRSQQVIYRATTMLMEQGRLRRLPIHLDSPMAVDATRFTETTRRAQASTD